MICCLQRSRMRVPREAWEARGGGAFGCVAALDWKRRPAPAGLGGEMEIGLAGRGNGAWSATGPMCSEGSGKSSGSLS